ncbi:hypothetical protein SADUNF_Sadunf04G0043000 [Salix dunnii]|uniref:Uncharacterized protein n=1 Tax=Salix dunnii TaxID=1413687 RepID=A0A835K5Y5_9ROSI|nr:hypothetical protein SADUNF_Sadunf04G0043000 [Salix dunnii]
MSRHGKKTMFIWISLVLFMTELLFALICCRPVIIPRARLRDESGINSTFPNNVPAQRNPESTARELRVILSFGNGEL